MLFDLSLTMLNFEKECFVADIHDLLYIRSEKLIILETSI